MDTAAATTRNVLDARDGSREAFAQLVRAHHQTVRAFLFRYLPQADVADDLAQEVFLVAFRRIGEYRGDAAFSSWLLGIARNLALDYLRHELRRKRRDVEASVARGQADRLDRDGIDAEQQEQMLAALRDCIAALPQSSRSLIERFYFENQPSESIARQMNKKAGAVRMWLLRIRGALGDCIEAKLQA